MKPLLVIFNPRRIPDAMESLEALEIDKLWIRNYPFTEIIKFLPSLLAECDHDAIGTLADDTIVPQQSLEMVLEAYEPSSVYTGYCRLEEGNELVNLSKSPLVVQDVATIDCYDFATKFEVDSHKGLFRSYFAGDSMTFMSREMWAKYPLQTAGQSGAQTDYSMCVRLQQDDVPIWGVPGAFFEHLKLNASTTHYEGGALMIESGMGSIEWDFLK
jgi:hypothetical protein